MSLAKILSATDFSPVSDRAVGYAAALARRYDAQLYLLHVLVPGENQSPPAEGKAEVNLAMRHQAQERIAGILASGLLRGVQHEVMLKEGYLWPTLDTLIRERELDLVVVGTHGLHGIKPSIGSSAELVFRHADCPVLTVGPAVASEASMVAEFKHILFATGFGRAAGRAEPYAFSLAQVYRAKLSLLHVLEPVGSDYSESELDTLRTITRLRLQECVPEEKNNLPKPEFIVRVGDPAEGILDVARQTAVDLIVMGARAGRNFASHLPETVAFTVAARAPCPVLTVRAY